MTLHETLEQVANQLEYGYTPGELQMLEHAVKRYISQEIVGENQTAHHEETPAGSLICSTCGRYLWTYGEDCKCPYFNALREEQRQKLEQS